MKIAASYVAAVIPQYQNGHFTLHLPIAILIIKIMEYDKENEAMKRLENKTAIVTGGNSGIGKATAILFAKEGADLVLCARRKEALDEVAEECRNPVWRIRPMLFCSLQRTHQPQ